MESGMTALANILVLPGPYAPRAPTIRNREYRSDDLAVYLPDALYDAAEQAGYDMRFYRRYAPIPVAPRLPPASARR